MPRLVQFLLVAFAGLWLGGSVHADDGADRALNGAKFNLDLRAFYFDRKYTDATPSRTALTLGGIAKVETGSLNGLQLGAAHFGNYSLGLVDRVRGVGTSLLESGSNDNLGFPGEAYVKYGFGQSSVQVGRQRLATPLANDHDTRALPDSYEAMVLRTREIPGTLLETGWITRFSEFGSRRNGFTDAATTWGNRGLAYVYAESTSINNLRLSGQYVKAVDSTGIAVRDYRYIGAQLALPMNAFVEGQYGGNDYQTERGSKMFGLLGGIKFQYVDLAFVYNKIAGNRFLAIDAGPMFADWQQGYANFEPSLALGGYVVFRLPQDVSIKVGRVNISAREASRVDDFKETMLDANWKINAANALRIRYSIKDQTTASGRPDANDFRVVYYYSFAY